LNYTANSKRYEEMTYHRTGSSGLLLPAMSLGLWHSFGEASPHANAREIILGAFDMGITHYDLANNYGPPPGSAEETFGRVINGELKSYRDEMIISTKAGYGMWEGPYGDHGSKKHLVSSLDQSLKRMNLEYVDIFYHHRPDSETPVEETMDALVGLVRSGKSLYIGLSNYSAEQTRQANKILKNLGSKCLILQPRYSMFEQGAKELFGVLEEEGIGSIAFSPLAQGLLTNKYIQGIPENSRAAGNSVFLNKANITPEIINKVVKLNEVAQKREQTLAQMALAWALKTGNLTSVILGASRLSQIQENVDALKHPDFTKDELRLIDTILK